LAVEADCDLRVLKKNPESVREYLGLLLEVGRRPSLRGAAAAMLSENDGTLERRIKIMTMPFPKKPLLRGLALAAIGGVFLAVACWAPSPDEVEGAGTEAVQVPPEIGVPGTPASAPAGASQMVDLPPPAMEVEREISAAPTFTPFTVRPDIQNRAEVARALEAEYPPLLRDAGIGGTVLVWFFIEETGRTGKVQLNESSGHKALDDAALRVAHAIEFTPAMNRDKAVPVWISLPITFTTSAGREPPPPSTVAPGKDLSAAPTFTPYTVRPDIKRPDYYIKQVVKEVIYPASVHKLPNPQVDLKRLDPALWSVLYGEG
jgi:protein TonB